MTKLSRRFKKNKKNRTIKRGGAGTAINNMNLSNNLSDVSNNAIVSTVDKTGATILNNVNEVLASDQVENMTSQAAQDTSDIFKRLSQNVNNKLNDPESKAEIENAIENIGDISSVLVDSMKEPVNKAINNTVETLKNTMPKLGAAAVKTGWDMAGAFPPLNIAIEGINVINDLTKAASAVAEAGTETAETISHTVSLIEKNFIKELDKKKTMSQQISNRTVDSIKEFENSNISQSAGGYKTRRRFLQSKPKTKRVRFAI